SYSITPSAKASNVGGISRPRARAVIKLVCFARMDHENRPSLTYARSWVESPVRTDAELMCCRLDFTQNLAARRIELEDMSVGTGGQPARIRADIDITGGTHGNAVQLTAELLLAQVPAVQIEPLQAAVFAVGDIESVIGNRNIVRGVEFAGAGAALAP